MTEEKKGIEQTKELFKALGILAGAAGSIMKDKKVSLADLGELTDLVTEFGTLKDGVEGADQILEEIKDLDKAEIVDLVATIYDAADQYEQKRKA